MNRAIAYQEQDCSLTLQEGLDIYYSLLDSYEDKSIRIDRIIDNDGSTTMRDHDCTHVIFGLDTSLEQEAMLDTWTIYGTKFNWISILKYSIANKDLRRLYIVFFKKLGLKGFIQLYKNVRPVKNKIRKRTKMMKKKWPYNCSKDLFNQKICDLRNDYGIKILNDRDRLVKKVEWLD
ncbi:MAG: hypothetical protein CBC38_01770 [Gammaproteobacteria bacterium TMED78]|nr:MAG: hypothetical protein CBC38_01770 [Gammaproteobacteria bacterium TMED78]|tara:strand:- start:182 stop:712 length:531 start_codon:yes stop_codon:yes gene_type:complete